MSPNKPSPLSAKALYYPLSQVERPMDSPASVLSLDSDPSDEPEKRPKPPGRSSSQHVWRAARPRPRACGRIWCVVLVVLALAVAHRVLPGDRHVPAQIASLSNSLPTQHGSFLHRWGLVTARSEGAALFEWVLHHIALGADQFIVYDASTPSDPAFAETRDRIIPLVELGWVTLVPIGGAPAAMRDFAARRFRSEWAAAPGGSERARWSIFLDVNEFIVHDDENDALPSWLDDGFNKVDGVELPRVWATAPADSPRDHELTGMLAAHSAVVEQDPFAAARVITHGRAPVTRVVDPVGGKSGEREAPASGAVEHYPLYLRRVLRRETECRFGKDRMPDTALEALDRLACEAHSTQSIAADDALVLRGERLAGLVRRLEERWPVFAREDFSLSMLRSPTASKRQLVPVDIAPGATLVVDSKRSDVGHLEVVLSTSETRRYLPVTYRSDGGASFSLPTATSAEFAAAGGYVTLNITRQYASSPAPEMDPPTPCSIMGHLRNQPTRPQLLALQDGECKDTDIASAYTIATATWPHARFRGEELFSHTVHLTPAAVAQAALSSAKVELDSLTTGHWARHSLQSLVAAAAERDSATRIYSSETCPRAFAPAYWDAACGTHERLEREGVLRWVPDGAREYTDVALRASELRTCLHADAATPEERRRIVVIGDSVASHSFMALQCLLTHLGIADSKRHVRFASLQYEALDLATGGISRETWDRFLAWEWDATASRAKSYPHVVVLNVGLWSATWTRATAYAAGLREALEHLTALSFPANPDGPRLVWRETTAVFPSAGLDPLYQVNPRVQHLNALATEEVTAAGEDVVHLGAYGMVAARGDAARDNAHLCPAVQGGPRRVLMHRVCRGGLLER